jgi:3-isopropylmalate/(R)-2-methylmalate dehydratase small subunit
VEPVSKVEGRAYPLGLKNIDTDVIIAAEWLKTISRTGLGKGAFQSLRAVPGNVFDDPEYAAAPILIAGDNFGCGSSREHAVWALAEYGIRCIIAESFAPIFRNNCVRNGLLPITCGRPVPEPFLGAVVTVDLADQLMSVSGHFQPFHIDAEAKAMLLEGLDAIDLTLKHRDTISAWQARDRKERPWVYL